MSLYCCSSCNRSLMPALLARLRKAIHCFQPWRSNTVTDIPESQASTCVFAVLQVRLLNVDVKEACASSTVQVIGRKSLDNSGPPDGPQLVSNAAHRCDHCCDYLLPFQKREGKGEGGGGWGRGRMAGYCSVLVLWSTYLFHSPKPQYG